MDSGYYHVPVLDWPQAYEFVFDMTLNAKYLADLSAAKTVRTGKIISRNTFAVTINDDAMMPRFLPGDIIVIDPEQSAHVGEYCLFTYAA